MPTLVLRRPRRRRPRPCSRLVACTAGGRRHRPRPRRRPPAPAGIVASMRPADGRPASRRAPPRSRPVPRTTRRSSRSPGPARHGVRARAAERRPGRASGPRELARLGGRGRTSVATFSWSASGERSVHRRGRRAAQPRCHGGRASSARRRAACTRPRLADDARPGDGRRARPARGVRRPRRTLDSSSYTGPLLVVASTDDRNVSALSSSSWSRGRMRRARTRAGRRSARSAGRVRGRRGTSRRAARAARLARSSSARGNQDQLAAERCSAIALTVKSRRARSSRSVGAEFHVR